MSVYRDKSGNCWISSCRFKNANGTPKRTTKRGFKTKEEAEEWERRLKSEANIRTLTLSEFFGVYARDIKPTVAASTWEGKVAIFRNKIEPYLGGESVEELSTPDVLLWQDLMRSMHKKDGTRYETSSPKTSTSRRVVQMPPFLEEELSAVMYLKGIQPHERIFPYTHDKMREQMRSATEKANLPRIRVRDLRHSHVSLLIDLGFPAPAIAERIGHSSNSVTYTYAHLFPTRQHDISNALEAEGGMR